MMAECVMCDESGETDFVWGTDDSTIWWPVLELFSKT